MLGSILVFSRPLVSIEHVDHAAIQDIPARTDQLGSYIEYLPGQAAISDFRHNRAITLGSTTTAAMSADEKTIITVQAEPAPPVGSSSSEHTRARGGGSSSEDTHAYKETAGYEVDVEDRAAGGADEAVRLARDGHTRLIPTPSDDPRDPLNWSSRKKHLALLVVAYTALLPDYGSATGAITLLPQAKKWRMSEDEVNHSQVGVSNMRCSLLPLPARIPPALLLCFRSSSPRVFRIILYEYRLYAITDSG